jgi:hypothetical protein
MSLPLPTYTPTPPAPPREEYTGLEELDRPELDDAPDTEREPLPPLDWDEDGESGIKRRG